MSATVTVDSFKQMIKFTAKAKTEGVNVPLFVWGAHGIGKTTIVGQVAKDLEYDYVTLNLANQSPEELLGLQALNKEKKQTDYYKPEWLKTESKVPVIYFLDELNRAPKYVLQSIFSFINEGRLHTHYINKDDIIIAAGNPGSLDYEVTEFEDKAFLSRFAHVYLEPTQVEVLQYMNEQDVHPSVIEMIKEDSDLFENISVNDADKLKITPDPRMMEKVGRVLNLISVEDLRTFGSDLVEAMIGIDKAVILIDKFKSQDSIPQPVKVLNGEVNLKKSFPHDRLDIINTFNAKLMKYLINEKILDNLDKFTDKMSNNFKKYIEYIPKDAAYGVIREAKLANVDMLKIIDLFSKVDEKILADIMEVGK